MKFNLLVFCFLTSITVFSQSGKDSKKSTKTPTGVTFAVDSVKKAVSPLNGMIAQDAFENKLDKKISFFPEELKNVTVIPTWNNSLVGTIHTSFDEHRPLTLTPDVIWLAIAQGVSIHINQHFDELETFIFKTDKPDKIVVRNDDLDKGSVHWVDLLHAFSDSTTKYVNDDYYAFFVPEFSTTTNIIRTSYEVTMLEGFSQAFEYVGDSGCGIPFITLQGTEKDWQGIYDRIGKIEELGLTTWANELRGMIQQFINVYQKRVDVTFWQSIYKDHSEYGGSYVSGWFIKLFPYLETRGEPEETLDEEGYPAYRAARLYYENPFLEGDRYLISRLQTKDFPSGIAEIDVLWQNYGTDENTKVHAGFYGMKQYDDLSLEPAIAWAVVRENDSEMSPHKGPRNTSETEHRHVYWSPSLIEPLLDSAIYDPTKYVTPMESYAFVKAYITTYLEKNAPESLEKLIGKSIVLLISSDGTMLETYDWKDYSNAHPFDGSGRKLDSAILKEITKAVKRLPRKWSPAHADYREFVFDLDPDTDTGEIVSIPANSMVRLDF